MQDLLRNVAFFFALPSAEMCSSLVFWPEPIPRDDQELDGGRPAELRSKFRLNIFLRQGPLYTLGTR